MNYELIDSGEGRRLEKFGEYILDRPDPEVLWKKTLTPARWNEADAIFKDRWVNKNNIPEKWQIAVNNLKFWLKLTPFKHTGIFPEQLFEWECIENTIKKAGREIKVLNLFAYTGVATFFAAKAGARVTHVDASRPAITWANENRELNGMQESPIRWIIDDALVFVNREIKRGSKYDAIIMDPPVYGHGPTGKPWSFSKDFPKLLASCKQILSDKPLFVLVNAYAVSTSPTTLANTMLGELGSLEGNIDKGELTLQEKSHRAVSLSGPEAGGRILSTGIWAMWSK